jgi:hypothetical protein
MRRRRYLPLLVALSSTLLASAGCRGDGYSHGDGEIDFDPDRPDFEDPESVPPYEGENELVLEAQSEFPTGIEFHQKVIWRTCTPNDGVCHNSKEYPDLRTPANFASAFGAPCNVQPGEYQSIYDGCELPGDRIRLGGAWDTIDLEIGYVEYLVGEESGGYEEAPGIDSPGLHIQLKTPITSDNDNTYTTAEFSRSFIIDGEVEQTVFTTFSTRWWLIEGGSHIVGEVRNYQTEEAEQLTTAGTLVQGDGNRNGVFGAEVYEPAALLEPGFPEISYLIARMRGEMHGEPVPGSRMPLANQPFTIPEMLAFFCLVEGYPADGDLTGLTGPIDYKNCSYSADPENLNLLGAGVTWEGRISKIFEFNCGGCHSGEEPQAGLSLVGEGVYERLLEPSVQNPDMKLIEPGPGTEGSPGEPENSYLYLKLIGDDSIEGTKMPYNPLTGEGSLTQAELEDIQTWIINGALEDE